MYFSSNYNIVVILKKRSGNFHCFVTSVKALRHTWRHDFRRNSIHILAVKATPSRSRSTWSDDVLILELVLLYQHFSQLFIWDPANMISIRVSDLCCDTGLYVFKRDSCLEAKRRTVLAQMVGYRTLTIICGFHVRQHVWNYQFVSIIQSSIII